VTFFREILGVEGAVRKAFPTFDDLTAFEQSQQFDKIQKYLVRLREKRSSVDAENEPTRVITVRLPKSMHEYLRAEAHDLHTSMNKLCISKLLQVIGEDLIPNERVGGGSESGSTSTPRPATTPAASTSFQPRPHQTAPASVPISTSHVGTSHQGSTHGATTPPFKPAQSRF
jgi:predicted HicB family RNase H-like nuclease